MIKKINEIFKRYYYILTSLLMFMSFPVYDIWFLKGFSFFAWFAFIPLFIFVRGKSFRVVYTSSFFATLLGNFLLYNWIGSFGADMAGGYYIVLTFLIPALSVFSAAKIVIAEFFSRRFEKVRIFIYPSVWILIDFIQSIGYNAFPWTYTAYSQYPFTSFIQISSYIGILGITFIIIISNSILSDLIYTKMNSKLYFRDLIQTSQFFKFIILIIFLNCMWGFGWYILSKNREEGSSDIRFSIIQSCISPWENWRVNRFKYLKDLKLLTDMSLNYDPDLIIWSESATLERISYHYEIDNLNSFEKSVLEIAAISKKPLLTGEIGVYRDYLSKRYYPQNNAVLINKEGEVVKKYSKINLVPFGEWFPYEKWFPFIKDLLIQFGGSSFVPGDTPVVFNIHGANFGVLICYEGIFYRLCRKYKNLGADFLVNITNDGWTDSYAGHMQHFSASIFRAIENGLWYIRAGNTGYTAIIDPFGRIKKSLPILKKDFLTGEIDLKLNHNTFYSKYGDIILYIAICFIFILAIIYYLSYIRKSYMKK